MAKSYSQAVKAQVLAQLAMGEPLARVAKAAGIPRSTVKSWRDDAKPAISPLATTEKNAREDLGSLVYAYLVAGLRALTAQAEAIADPEYIKAQGAGELYLLHGTLADKLVYLLRAIERGNPDEPGEDRPAGVPETPGG